MDEWFSSSLNATQLLGILLMENSLDGSVGKDRYLFSKTRTVCLMAAVPGYCSGRNSRFNTELYEFII